MPVTGEDPDDHARARRGGQPVVEGEGATLRELLQDLERRYPGMTERILTRRRRGSIGSSTST